MRIGVLGTGTVGRALAGKLDELGHEVAMGSRDPNATSTRSEPERPGMESFAEWRVRYGGVRLTTFAEAANEGELLVLASSGAAALDVLASASPADLRGKVLLDITNAIDPTSGFPPSLFVTNTDSLAEQIQRAHPELRVVKSLNTVTAAVMVDPVMVGNGEHTMFVAGNDDDAKRQVTDLLQNGFGWKHVLDLGDVTAARGMEMYLALWLRILLALESPMFNIAVLQ